jgi:serine/threonine-protein kinase
VIARLGAFEYALAERYRFEDELGRGAMGTVYRARDLRLGRPVAIKMLHSALTNELGVARFQSEIHIAAALHHPGIIGIHDCGEADGHLFYVMEYLGGETLRSRLRRERQLSIDAALSIAREMAAGLQYAHERSIVHRDVKPENIILADDRVCLVDFGLARIINDSGSERLTETGIAVGTPQYLSPEQASADKHIGVHSDQYALACVLYEMLVGEPPFTGATATAIAMRHVRDAPVSLSTRRPDAPTATDAAVMRALRKAPDDRFASIRDFAAAATSLTVDAAPSHAATPKRSTYSALVDAAKRYWR